MSSQISAAVIAGAVAFVVGILTSAVSLWVYRNQVLTEMNAVRLAKKLLKQRPYQWRAFEMFKRRIATRLTSISNRFAALAPLRALRANRSSVS